MSNIESKNHLYQFYTILPCIAGAVGKETMQIIPKSSATDKSKYRFETKGISALFVQSEDVANFFEYRFEGNIDWIKGNGLSVRFVPNGADYIDFQPHGGDSQLPNIIFSIYYNGD